MKSARSFILLGLCVASIRAEAGELVHVVAPGQSISGIAKHFYGSSWKSVYIATRNQLSTTALQPGQKLIIPSSWEYRIRKGDSLGKIAKRYLGDINRYEAIVSFNGLKSATSIDLGQELLMPFHLKHKVTSGQGFSHISKKYYRTTRRAKLLQQYNGNPTLKPHSELVIPIFDRSTLDPKSRTFPVKPGSQKKPERISTPKAQSTPPKKEHSTKNSELTRAIEMYNDGNYSNACAILETLLAETSDDAGRRKIIQYLGFCAVAAGEIDAAHDYFAKLLDLAPNFSLNPVTTSPKILAVVEEVRNQVVQPKPKE